MAKYTFLIGETRTFLPIRSDDVLWFGKALTANGVDLRARVTPPIAAARDLGIAVHLARLIAGHELVPAGVHLEVRLPGTLDLGVAAAICSLIRTLRRTELGCPRLFEACWPAILSGAPLAVPQRRTADRDHVWEFLNAATYSTFAADVDVNLTGRGVDVVGRVRDVLWGIECKALYSAQAPRRVDRIIEGVKQVESDPAVDRGVVAVNVTNCLDHEPFRQSLAGHTPVFAATGDAREALAAAVRSVARQTCTRQLQQRLARDKKGRPRLKCRALIFLGQTVALADHRVNVFTAQISVLRKPAEASDREFVNSYATGWLIP